MSLLIQRGSTSLASVSPASELAVYSEKAIANAREKVLEKDQRKLTIAKVKKGAQLQLPT